MNVAYVIFPQARCAAILSIIVIAFSCSFLYIQTCMVSILTKYVMGSKKMSLVTETVKVWLFMSAVNYGIERIHWFSYCVLQNFHPVHLVTKHTCTLANVAEECVFYKYASSTEGEWREIFLPNDCIVYCVCFSECKLCHIKGPVIWSTK